MTAESAQVLLIIQKMGSHLRLKVQGLAHRAQYPALGVGKYSERATFCTQMPPKCAKFCLLNGPQQTTNETPYKMFHVEHF